MDFFLKKLKQNNKGPSTEELIERGFAPKNGRIDVLLIHPPSTIAERYGKEDMGEFGGDLIPLGIASLAGYLREKGYGVGVLDCPALRINSNKVHEIILNKDPSIIGFSTTTYSLARAVEIGKKVREKLPNKLTIVGGSHANVAGIETANRYNIPTFIFAKTISSLNGITAQAIKAKVKVTTGAKINITLLALAGIIISLKINFNASATVCKSPNGPTTFGPFLFWTKAQTLLSSHTIKATETKTGKSKKIIL
mgnify:CR=1 FL=1